MDINNIANNLTWKKMAAIVLVIITANWMIHEVIMWRYFNKIQQTMNRFNDQFEQDQQRIHNKIMESENDFNKWSKTFAQQQNEFSAVVDREMKENMDFIQNSQQKMAEQQKAFDKKFSEMPDKMWEAHKAFGKQAFDTFQEHREQMDELSSEQFKQDAMKDKSRQLNINLKKEADERSKWEAARIRYHETYGVWLPKYVDAFKNNKSQ